MRTRRPIRAARGEPGLSDLLRELLNEQTWGRGADGDL